MESVKGLAPLKVELKERSLDIINEIFPKKSTDLTYFLEHDPIFKHDHTSLTQVLKCSPVSDSNLDEELLSKKRKITNTESLMVGVDNVIPLHVVISKIKIRLKKEASDMLKYLSTVRLWIQLNVPRIEDGNNFGVQVQEDMISEISKAEENAFTAIDLLTKYHANRAKMISKYLKYPQVEDYAECVYEIDQKYYADIITGIRDLRNNYAGLYDSLHKNLDKILIPRSSHTAAMF